MTNIDFPKFIKTLRHERNLSQQKFADKIGVSYKTVQSWEYNYASPSRFNIQTIIDKFGLMEEEYPELFEYISRSRAKNWTNGSKKIEDAENNGTEENCESEKQPLLKRILNAPLKIIVFCVSALLIAVGTFFGVYTILSNFIAYSNAVVAIISIVCAAAAVIAVSLLVHFLVIKRRKK